GLDSLSSLPANARGSFHPLQSFPAPRAPSAFRGITVAVDATTPTLRRRLAALARMLGARPKHVTDGERVLYHAAAVFASNFVDVVIAEAVRLLTRIGWSGDEATRALMPLVDGAVANIRKRGAVQALTGPIRRGDADTVKRHMDALRKLGSGPSGPSGHLPMNGEETYRVYRMLGLGMVMLGHPPTRPVTLDDMLHHAKAVARGARQALLVGDMPFMSYHESAEQAIASAGRFIQEAGMHSVKLEGGGRVVEITRRL